MPLRSTEVHNPVAMNSLERSNAAPVREPFTNDSEEASEDNLAPSGRGRKVLVVDDNAVVLKAFETKLKASGFNVFLARDTASAVTAARTKNPDLIILDIHFPPDGSHVSMNWSGLNVLQWLKRFEELSAIPVVVVSGDEPAKQEQKILAVGAAAYFQKPLDFKAFAKALLPLLKLVAA